MDMEEAHNISRFERSPGSPYAASYEEASDKHANILIRLAQGYSQEATAKLEGCIADTVRKVSRHPPYRDWLREQKRKFAVEQLKGYQLLAAAQSESSEILLSLLRNPDLKPKERLDVIKYFNDFLDRSGGKRGVVESVDEPEDRAVSSQHLDREKARKILDTCM